VIRLSQAARAQVSGLASYYDDHDRPDAVRNLRAADAHGPVVQVVFHEAADIPRRL
jgi:hypothetical protein